MEEIVKKDRPYLFQKGNPGKPKGYPNKVKLGVKAVRACFIDAFNELQKDPKANVIAWGKANPSEFYKILPRILPLDFQDQEGKKIVINVGTGETSIEDIEAITDDNINE